MGVSPANAPREGRSGISAARTVLLAVVYLLLVPAVAAAGLWAAATYFPAQTRSLLGPAMSALVTEAPSKDTSGQDALAKAAQLEERIAKMEADVAGILERELTASRVSPGEPLESETEEVPADGIHERLERDRILAALSAVTMARVQAVTGNREVAAREAELALGILGETDPAFAPADTQEMLQKAVDALRLGSPTVDDWLSLAWHSLVEAMSPAH